MTSRNNEKCILFMGGSMISVTRFNDSTLIINADLIQTVEYKRRIFVNSPVNYREQTY